MAIRTPATRKAILAGVLLVLAASTSSAQTQPQQQPAKKPGIVARSEVVLVPAIVTDHKGAHVPDLTEANFTILENGQAQKIAFFHHVKAATEPAANPSAPAGAPPTSVQTRSDRSAILVFDLLNSSITEQQNARDELMKFLTGAPELAEPVCLIAFDGAGIRLLHDFTRDPALLLAALQETKGQRSPKDTPSTNPLASMYRGVNGWNSRSANRSAAAAQGRQTFLNYSVENEAGKLGLRTWLTLEALREIGEAYSGIPGRKSLIWATGGFPFEMGDAARFGMYERQLLPAYEETWRTLNRGNIAVYPLDVEDLINPAFVSPNTGQPLPQHFGITSDVSKMESFAESTGGKLCDRQTTALSCFNAAADDSSDYYLIGFYPSAGDATPGWRKLSIKVDRPSVQVRARSGYYVSGPRDENTARTEDIEIALTSPLDFTAVPFTVRVISTKENHGKKSVAFAFLIPPGVVTVDESDANHVNLDFAALAVRPDGTRVEDGFSQNLEGHIKPEGVTVLSTKGLSFPGSMDVPSGEYSLRFVIRDNINGQVGSATASLKVP
jgi:VWFA-related protein